MWPSRLSDFSLLALFIEKFDQPSLRAIRVLRPLKLVTGFESKSGVWPCDLGWAPCGSHHCTPYRRVVPGVCLVVCACARVCGVCVWCAVSGVLDVVRTRRYSYHWSFVLHRPSCLCVFQVDYIIHVWFGPVKLSPSIIFFSFNVGLGIAIPLHLPW